jgi:2-(1,2-epoxy-1,2-dihydrophenyl)acetyl-CoA isomerase
VVLAVAAGATTRLRLMTNLYIIGYRNPLLVPDWGQLLTLPRRVGLPTARRLLISEKPVTGAEALLIGLADTLVPDADVMAEAIRVALALAALPAEAFARMKARLNAPSSLDEELRRDEDDQATCLCTDDFREGCAAFSERRAPDFVKRPGAAR